jgi:ribokinase
MPPQVVSLGDLVADLIVPIAQLPVRPWEHQLARDMLIEAGGTGNFLTMAARLGLRAMALGVAGQDFFGEQVLAALANEGVDLTHVIVPPHSRTTVSIVLVDDAAQHVFVWMNGTGQQQPFDPAWRAIIEPADAVFTTGYALQPTSTFAPSAVKTCLDIAHARKIPVFFDLGPAAAQAERADLDATIARTTVLLGTDEEIAARTGIDDPRRAAGELLAQGPAMVIVKLGGRGCLIVTAEQHALVDAFPVAVRNTAGAGDAFSAACVYGYLQGYSIEQIGILANAVGAASVATLGTGTRLPHKQEIARLLSGHGHTFFEGQ